MKNIVLAIDAGHLDKKSLAFSCYLAKLSRSPLKGLFLGYVQPDEQPGVKFAYGSAYVENIDTRDLPEKQFGEKMAEQDIAVFKNTCRDNDVTSIVIRDTGVAMEGLLTECRYADLLIVESGLFSVSPLDSPSDFVKELLSKAECPVVICPYHYEDIKEIAFAYDCQASSVFAIKQFTYLFPELGDRKISVIQVDAEGNFDAADKEKIYNYLKVHYADIEFKDLAGNTEDQLFDNLLRKNDAIVVMGAYGRNRLSNFFRRSTAELLIEMNDFPLFIAHG